MPGFKCSNESCDNRTFRRPPNNQCEGCRSCRRGINRRGPKVRFEQKRGVSHRGKPVSASTADTTGSSTAVVQPIAGAIKEVLGQSPKPAAAKEIEGQRSQKPAAPRDYDGARNNVDAVYDELSKLFGRANARNILACAQGTINKFEKAQKPLDADTITIVAVSIALRGDIQNEEMRRQWYAHCKRVSVHTRKALEAKLIMALPFSSDLADGILLADVASNF